MFLVTLTMHLNETTPSARFGGSVAKHCVSMAYIVLMSSCSEDNYSRRQIKVPGPYS